MGRCRRAGAAIIPLLVTVSGVALAAMVVLVGTPGNLSASIHRPYSASPSQLAPLNAMKGEDLSRGDVVRGVFPEGWPGLTPEIRQSLLSMPSPSGREDEATSRVQVIEIPGRGTLVIVWSPDDWIVVVLWFFLWGAALFWLIRRQRGTRRPGWWWVRVAVATLLVSFVVVGVVWAVITAVV